MFRAILTKFEDSANWGVSLLDRFLDRAWEWVEDREKDLVMAAASSVYMNNTQKILESVGEV
jgi:hypothetical protein